MVATMLVYSHIRYRIVGKFGQGKVWRIDSFRAFGERKLQINRSANRLLIVSTNLDGFSLVNHRQFAKFVKLSHYMVKLL